LKKEIPGWRDWHLQDHFFGFRSPGQQLRDWNDGLRKS